MRSAAPTTTIDRIRERRKRAPPNALALLQGPIRQDAKSRNRDDDGRRERLDAGTCQQQRSLGVMLGGADVVGSPRERRKARAPTNPPPTPPRTTAKGTAYSARAVSFFSTEPPTTAPTRAPSTTHLHTLPCWPSSTVAVEALGTDNAMWLGIDGRKTNTRFGDGEEPSSNPRSLSEPLHRLGDALGLRARSGTGYQSDHDKSSHLLPPQCGVDDT